MRLTRRLTAAICAAELCTAAMIMLGMSHDAAADIDLTRNGSSSSVSTNSTEQDTLCATLSFDFDDNYKEDFDSAGAFRYPGHWNYVAGLTVEPQSCRVSTGGDTTNNLSLAKIQALYRRGWSMGTVGWDEKGSLYSQFSGKVATGNFTSENAFRDNLHAAVLSMRDTLGIGAPQWISWSFSSATFWQERLARLEGINYGFTGVGAASGSSTDGWRPNAPWAYGRWSTPETVVGGDTTSDGILCCALPGLHDDPMQMAGVIGENTDSLTFKRVIAKAVANKSMVFWCGHKLSTWDLNLDGHLDGPGGTNDGKLRTAKQCIAWVTKTYVKTGKLRIVPLHEAFQMYCSRPISPTANYINTEFEDFDHFYMNPSGTARVPDNWFSWTSGNDPAGRTRAAISWPKTGGYGGHKYVTMKWAPNTARAFWGLGPTKRPWFNQMMVAPVFCPPGGNYIAHVEVWMIADTTVSGWAGGTAPQLNDSVGVAFYGVTMDTWNDYAGNSPKFQIAGSEAGGGMLFTGNYYVGPNSNRWGQTTVAANGRKLNARNNISRTGHEWAHVTASFRYPGDSQILMINLWKGNQIPSDGIRVSYPYVTFEKIAN